MSTIRENVVFIFVVTIPGIFCVLYLRLVRNDPKTHLGSMLIIVLLDARTAITPPPPQTKSVRRMVLCRMQLTIHATRLTSASGRFALSARDACLVGQHPTCSLRINGHETTAMHETSTPLPRKTRVEQLFSTGGLVISQSSFFFVAIHWPSQKVDTVRFSGQMAWN